MQFEDRDFRHVLSGAENYLGCQGCTRVGYSSWIKDRTENSIIYIWDTALDSPDTRIRCVRAAADLCDHACRGCPAERAEIRRLVERLVAIALTSATQLDARSLGKVA